MAAQDWSAADYAKNAGFVPMLGAPLLDLLGARPGERILDIGCGDGLLTEAIAASGATVVGVDSAISMIDAARARGIDAHVMDGQNLEFDAQFDAVFSNAALHWMADADAVLAGVNRALVPGGRFVGEFGGHGNVAAIVTAIHAVFARRRVPIKFKWFFPSARDYAEMLTKNGFEVSSITLTPRPTELPTGIAGWLVTFAGPFMDGPYLKNTPPEVVREVFAEIERLLVPALRTQSGRWIADYVRLRFKATKPQG